MEADLESGAYSPLNRTQGKRSDGSTSSRLVLPTYCLSSSSFTNKLAFSPLVRLSKYFQPGLTRYRANVAVHR